jgi:hypothetical protein
VTQTTLTAPRRHARFVAHRVIPPDGCEPNRWYTVCEGRRREDNRPGMVVLDVGTHRVSVPEICVEVRAGVPAAGTTPAPATPPASVRRRRWAKRVALAVTVPLGLIAVAAVGLLATRPTLSLSR